MIRQQNLSQNASCCTRRRVARAAVVWAIGIFAGLQLGLAAAIEGWLPQLRDPEYGCRMTRLCARVAARPRPYTVVMLGSSRTTAGFDANRLEKYLQARGNRPVVAFNFGITGAGPLMQFLDLRRLLDRGIRPDMLLVEVLPPLLAGQVPRAEICRLQATRLWLRELELAQSYGADFWELHAQWWQAWPVPWYARRLAIVNRLAPALLPTQMRTDWIYQIDDCGWVVQAFGSPSKEQRRQATLRTQQEYAYYLKDFKLGGPACRALRELLVLCRQQEIPTALVLMPEGSAFRSFYSPSAWAQIDAFLSGLSREFATPLIDARAWIADDDFFDSHHLLLPGATAFTDRLCREAFSGRVPICGSSPLRRNSACVAEGIASP
jgi:hypothetical protein